MLLCKLADTLRMYSIKLGTNMGRLGTNTGTNMESKFFSLVCALLLLLAGRAFAQSSWSSRNSSNDNINIELESVGSLSVSNLYFAYIMLGTVGEAFSQGLYDAEITTNIAQETRFLNAKSRDTLQELMNTRSISEEDLEIMYKIIDSYNLLIHTAEALAEFAATKDSRSFTVFRDRAWRNISVLLDSN